MGFFSWRTSDTNEPIYNQHTEGCRPVYLLQPGKKPNIQEPSYDGYGVFGGMDAYVWLATHNMPVKDRKGMDEDALRSRGIAMELSSFYVDKDDGSKWGMVAADNPYGIQPFVNAELDFDTQYKKALSLIRSPEKLDTKGEEALRNSVKKFINSLPQHSGNYGDPQPKYDGKDPNELIASGQWISHNMGEIMLPEGHEYKPLKFSFDPDAKYEDLPAAKNHQGQGFWEDEEQEELVEALCQT